MNRFAPLWFGLLSLIPSACGAASAANPQTSAVPPGVPGRTLTLPEALVLAGRFNPSLQVGAASVEGAEAGIVSARAYLNPTVSFGSLGRQQALLQSAAVPGMLHGLNFSQGIELPALRDSRIRAAQVRRQTAQLGLAEIRLAVHGAVKQAFYEALRRKQEVELAMGNVGLLEDLRRRIQVQVDVGEAAKLELTRAEAEVATSRIALRSSELRLAAAMSALYAAVGTPLGRVELVGDLERQQILPPLETLREEMLTKHPSLKAAASQTRYTEAVLENEKAQRIPQPNVWMDWFQQPESAQYRIGVTIPIPVWNRREGPIAEAVAGHRQAVAQSNVRRVQLLAALERAYSMYQVASQQVDIFETGTLREAQAALEAAQAAFKYGERGIIEVLDAQRVLRAARFDYLNARYDRQQALIELEQLRAID